MDIEQLSLEHFLCTKCISKMPTHHVIHDCLGLATVNEVVRVLGMELMIIRFVRSWQGRVGYLRLGSVVTHKM